MAPAVCLLLVLPALLLAYSEEDWRAYSRTKVEMVDTFSLPFEAAGPFVLLGDKLVFLSKGRDSLISLDTATRAIVGRAGIASAWNMDISAMTAYDGKLYVLSRSTRAIYCYEPEREGWTSKVLLDLGKVHFDGEPMLTTFAYDGEHVYMVILAGFSTYITRIGPDAESHPIAYVGGRPTAVCHEPGVVYYMSHQARADTRPGLCAYADHVPSGQREARLLFDIELPTQRSGAICVRDGCVLTTATGAKLCTMRLK
jgi:hypothetical protein